MPTSVRDLFQAAAPVKVEKDAKERELHSNLRKIHVEFEKFYGVEPTYVDRRFDIVLSDLSYLPKVDNPTADWVIAAAFNAFKAYKAAGFGSVHRFATVGTGSGTDVIAALDTFFEISGVAMTDLFEEVVTTAKSNVVAATEKGSDKTRRVVARAAAKSGDLLLPLKDEEAFDLIYENLPNIPLLDDDHDLKDGQTSSTYVGNRSADKVPRSISVALLDLHYVCLVQAKNFNLLSSAGTILSSIGGRVPIQTLLELADVAGYSGRILTIWWKEQSEPESVIGGYAEHEKKGLGPFFFYPTSALKQAFSNRTPAGAGLHTTAILEELLPHRLNAVEALQKHRQGVKIGHTVVVMASVLKSAKSQR